MLRRKICGNEEAHKIGELYVPQGTKEVEGLAPKGGYEAAHVILRQPIILYNME